MYTVVKKKSITLLSGNFCGCDTYTYVGGCIKVHLSVAKVGKEDFFPVGTRNELSAWKVKVEDYVPPFTVLKQVSWQTSSG